MIRNLIAKLRNKGKLKNADRGNGQVEQRFMQKSAWEWLWSEKINGWYVMSGQSRHTGRWAAWAKKTPLIKRDPLGEPGDVYFEGGISRQNALDRLTASDLIA